MNILKKMLKSILKNIVNYVVFKLKKINLLI